jgi:hypothetical protein
MFGRLLWGMGPGVVVRCHYFPESHSVLLDLLPTRYFVVTKNLLIYNGYVCKCCNIVTFRKLYIICNFSFVRTF